MGGAPRSGTTWLQQILDAHPDVSCRGEGLFPQELAAPLDALLAQRGKALAAKNAGLFRHTGGYPLPDSGDADMLLGTAILLALRRQCAEKPACRALGEKTPENVFLFPRLKSLFPGAKFVGILRDPRDVLTSAWHFFQTTGARDDAAKRDFIARALPVLRAGARAMIALDEQYPDDCLLLTYEGLRAAPDLLVAGLFRFLGVGDTAELVAASVARTDFAAQTGGRPAGVAQDGAFFRKGVVGDWRATLTPEMNATVLRELGGLFPTFGWQP